MLNKVLRDRSFWNLSENHPHTSQQWLHYKLLFTCIWSLIDFFLLWEKTQPLPKVHSAVGGGHLSTIPHGLQKEPFRVHNFHAENTRPPGQARHRFLGLLNGQLGANTQKTLWYMDAPGCEDLWVCRWTHRWLCLVSWELTLVWAFNKPAIWVNCFPNESVIPPPLYKFTRMTELPYIPNFVSEFPFLVCWPSYYYMSTICLLQFQSMIENDSWFKILAWIFLYLLVQMEFNSRITLPKNPIEILIEISLKIYSSIWNVYSFAKLSSFIQKPVICLSIYSSLFKTDQDSHGFYNSVRRLTI